MGAIKTLPSLKSSELVVQDATAGLQLDSLRYSESIEISTPPDNDYFVNIIDDRTPFALDWEFANLHTLKASGFAGFLAESRHFPIFIA